MQNEVKLRWINEGKLVTIFAQILRESFQEGWKLPTPFEIQIKGNGREKESKCCQETWLKYFQSTRVARGFWTSLYTLRL